MNTFIFCALCAIILLLPLPYGSVEPWSIFIFEAITLLLFGIHLVGEFAKKGGSTNEDDLPISGSNDHYRDLKTPLIFKILLALFFALTLIQILPLPPPVIKLLSPNAYEIFQGTGQKGWLTLSLSPHLTAFELLKYLCYFLFGYLIFRHVRSRQQIEIFVWVMMAGAVFQSLYGLAEFFGGTHRIFGWKNLYYYDSVFGTFVNRNHFAGFLEMTLSVSIGYLLAKADFFALKKGLSIRDRILWFGHERLQKAILFGVTPVIIGIGLFFSRSRGGVFNFFVSILFMITAISWTGKRGHISGTVRDQTSRAIIRTIFIVVVSAALLIGVIPLLLERFSPDVVRGEGRPVLYENTIEMMGQFPLFGTGPGTYVYAYPKYEKTGTSRLMDHAHNDYLELLAESGAIAGGCLLLSVFGTLIVLLGRWTKRKDYFMRGITIGCLAGIVAILVHSIGDFNLRIPANAVYFVSLFALAMTTSGSKTDDFSPLSSRGAKRRGDLTGKSAKKKAAFGRPFIQIISCL